MNIYTIGFAQKKASDFFTIIKKNKITKVVDVRLNNTSQLAAFAKQDDLRYFLKEICGISYEHFPEFAPTPEILEGWKKKKITWEEYEEKYLEILTERDVVTGFIHDGLEDRIVLLCSEPTPEHCHRRLTAEAIANRVADIQIVHL